MSAVAIEARPPSAPWLDAAALQGTQRWQVHKFGGSCLEDADGFRRVVEILADAAGARAFVVVSAVRGVTDALLALVEAVRSGRFFATDLEDLVDAQRDLIDALAPGAKPLADALDRDAGELSRLLAELGAGTRDTTALVDRIAGFGEFWSARLLVAALERRGLAAAGVDARDLIVVEATQRGADAIAWDDSARLVASASGTWTADLVVAPGFVARTRQGVVATLGRNGSDLSAAAFARLLDAQTLTVWKDVAGVLSADPRLVRHARTTPELSYAEAEELAAAGARVLHPDTLRPLRRANVPVLVRSSRDALAPGSRIVGVPAGCGAARAVTLEENVVLLGVRGAPPSQTLAALEHAGVQPRAIVQCNARRSLDIVVAAGDRARAEQAIEAALGASALVEWRAGLALLRAVRAGFGGDPRRLAALYGALAELNVPIHASFQDGHDHGVSVLLPQDRARAALSAVHARLCVEAPGVAIAVVGTGLVGGTLLRQLERELPGAPDLRLVAVANSRATVVDTAGIAPAQALARLAESTQPADLDAAIAALAQSGARRKVVIDATPAEAVAQRHVEWLAAGIHVVSANKIAQGTSRDRWDALRRAERSGATRYGDAATVGAGLPALKTLRRLQQSGDALLALEGVFSGSLSFLFNRYDGTRPFSALLAEARERGYTEPDPRADLSGGDVARKLLILARAAGFAIDEADVRVSGLVPDELVALPVDAFLARIGEVDAHIAQRHAAAAAEGKVLRYLASLSADGRATVGLEAVPLDHPSAKLSGADNLFVFTTERYRERPLVIAGPGAGADVTALALLADTLEIAAA
ncbi:bifunctional aspartate kinase/homoserine dehydrogenase II [Tahibacter soli]|uniref:Bifunctional aspartokinase/homoserine dehydrogenase n=1 Tax=Tahibacter soli TaxID=2983605 RepID=A0A9X3YID4_9GAMM|nr:bifunctional aspartate kinase/homoserine dehydrogenase II [Tahibacter soli]MDC8011328.1 bifunctional aspartate kinase/homoserine dehydrogenase II [Tahibacter soli]